MSLLHTQWQRLGEPQLVLMHCMSLSRTAPLVFDTAVITSATTSPAGSLLEQYTFQTYTKIHQQNSLFYFGRTSGLASPATNVLIRDYGHVARNALGFEPATLESNGGVGLVGYFSIRGREQQLIDFICDTNNVCGIGSKNLDNKIRGVGKNNQRGLIYHLASDAKFGNLAPYTGN